MSLRPAGGGPRSDGTPPPQADAPREPDRWSARLRGVKTLIGLLVVALMAAGCGAGAAVDPLGGRDFLSTSVTADGEPFALVDGTRVRLSFADGRLTASAGCNTIGYTYQLDGDTLVVEGGAMTEMGCDPALHDQDEWLSEFLASRPTVAANGNDLVLTSDGTVMDLLDAEVAEPDLALAGTLWTVDSIISADAVSSIPAGVDGHDPLRGRWHGRGGDGLQRRQR